MDTQQDAPRVTKFRLEIEVQEYITMTFVVIELKSALGKKKITLELWDSRHVKKRRQQDCHRQLEYQSQRYSMAIMVKGHMDYQTLLEFGQEKMRMLSISRLLWLKDQSGRMWFGELPERNRTTRLSVRDLLRKKDAVSGTCHYLRSKP